MGARTRQCRGHLGGAGRRDETVPTTGLDPSGYALMVSAALPKGSEAGDHLQVTWPAVRTFAVDDFDLDALLAARRGQTISVCLPARNEGSTVGHVVRTIVREFVEQVPLVDEVLVIDDGSTDDTALRAAEAGAVVVGANDVLPECGPGTGKGEALWKSLAACEGDLIVWCDADIRDFEAGFVTGLLGPLLLHDGIDFVKGFYDRPIAGSTDQGGRVTELVARPLVALFFPHLASYVQPLAGEYAGRRSLLEQVPFEQGYGVDLGLLIDLAAETGLDAMAQVDLGTRVHRNRPLDELSPQALAILHSVLARADVPLPLWPSVLVRPGTPPVTVHPGRRPPIDSVAGYRRRRADRLSPIRYGASRSSGARTSLTTPLPGTASSAAVRAATSSIGSFNT